MLPPDSVTVWLAPKVPTLLALRLNTLGVALKEPDDWPVTLKITGNCNCAPMLGTLKVTLPEYAPGARPDALAKTRGLAGVVPLLGLTESQLESTVALQLALEPFVKLMVTVWDVLNVPVLEALRLNDPGLTEIDVLVESAIARLN